MKTQIVLNCAPGEVRVALLEGGDLAEIHIERSRDRGAVGNVYKGRVQRVLPGMQAAFVDVGFEKAAFLHASDFRTGLGEMPRLFADEDRGEDGVGESAADLDTEPIDAGEVEVGAAETAAAASAAGVEAARARPSARPSSRTRARFRRTPLEDELKRGQEILVQVSKEPIGTKGARVTSHVSLAGRFLVYMPTTEHIGVSRRIADPEERRRLKELVVSLRPPRGGFIVRTVCEGLSRREIEADIAYLTRLWSQILKRNEACSAPAMVYNDMDLVQRTVRDFFAPEVGRVIVDSEREYRRIVDLVDSLAPRQRGRVALYEEPLPIFERFNVEAQIERALSPRVGLRSGGYLVIEQTEALTAIDVNTGRYVGKRNLEDTLLKTNLEAAEEVVRQLRLRNIGGLIIIDFIDMENDANRQQVSEALIEAVRQKDKAQTKILKISELGLVEMTRKRSRESLEQSLSAPCAHCEGTGRTKSPATIGLEILRRLAREAAHAGRARLLVKASPPVAAFLYDSQSRALDEMERALGKKIVVKAQEGFREPQYEIVVG